MAVENAAEGDGLVDPPRLQAPLLQPRIRTAVLVAAGVLGVIIVRDLFVAAHQVLGWAVAASLLALLIEPAIQTLDRALPRPVAAIISFVLLIGVIVGVNYLYSAGVRNEVGRLSERGPEIAAEIEERGDRIGNLASDIGLEAQIADLTERLTNGVGSSGETLREAALAAPSYLVTMILTVFLIVYGGRMVRGGLDQLPDGRRDVLDVALPAAARRAQIYVGAALVQAAVNGVSVYVAARLIDAPAPGLLALFAATLALLPYLGVALGWIPLVLLAVGLVSLGAVALLILVAGLFQVAEALVWRPRVDSVSLHVGPVIPLVTAVLGFAIYGVGGALCATGVMVFVLALVDRLTDGQDLPTPVDAT